MSAYVLASVWNWAEVRFRYKSNTAFCTFFFFFFWISARIVRFGRYSRYGRFKPESAQIRMNRPESEPHRRESAKSTWNPRGTTRPDARAAPSPARRRVLPRRTWCGTSGATSVLHRFREPQMKTTKKRQLRKWRILGDFKFQDTYTAAIDDVYFVVQRVPWRFQFYSTSF